VAASLIFPTDLASFFELLRLHGDEAYGLIFAFAASHSMLLTLFAGYASSSGSLDLGTLVAVVWAGSFLGDTTTSPHRRHPPKCLKKSPSQTRANE